MTDLHLYIHFDISSKETQELKTLLTQFLEKGGQIMADLTSLTAQVQANTQVETSAVTLIQGLADQLRALANDPVAIAALADQLKGSADALSAAIVANTPAA